MYGGKRPGYKKGISSFIVSSFKDNTEDENVELDVEEALAQRYAIA